MSRRSQLLGKRKNDVLEGNINNQNRKKRCKLEAGKSIIFEDVSNQILARDNYICDSPQKYSTNDTSLNRNVKAIRRLRPNPLPSVTWGSSSSIWRGMLEREATRGYKRDPVYFERHPEILHHMRAILLEWIMEVCEVYALLRETFYIAVDIIDRYFSRTINLPKNKVQLVGITALFIAAKAEEIYPPRLSEFVYVTDGACNEDEVIELEIQMLETLNWNISCITPINWFSMFLQLDRLNLFPTFSKLSLSPQSYSSKNVSHSSPKNIREESGFLPYKRMSLQEGENHFKNMTRVKLTDGNNTPTASTLLGTNSGCLVLGVKDNSYMSSDVISFELKEKSITVSDDQLMNRNFSQFDYVQAARLLDLCCLDANWLRFSYSLLAAACLAIIRNMDVANQKTGYSKNEMLRCVNWMSQFYETLKEEGPVENRIFRVKISDEHKHNIQTRAASVNILEKAHLRYPPQIIEMEASVLYDTILEKNDYEIFSSPEHTQTTITPPSTNKKIFDKI